MAEKKVEVDPVTNEVKVPIDLTSFEVERLEEKLEIFNKNVPEGSKLSFEEFIKLVFEVSLLEEDLDVKYNYLRRLKYEVKELEEDLVAKYSIGLTGSEEVYNEVMELRKKTLEDSLIYVRNFKTDYVKALANHISYIVYGMDFDDGIITLPEVFEEDIENNLPEVKKALQIVKHGVEPDVFKDVPKLINYFEEYLDSI